MIADFAIAKKVADLVRRLASPRHGAVIVTVRALLRVLEANGLDIHAVAGPLDAPNGKHVSEEQIWRDAWTPAYAQAVQELGEPAARQRRLCFKGNVDGP